MIKDLCNGFLNVFIQGTIFLLAILYQFLAYGKGVVTSKLEENMNYFFKLTNPILIYHLSRFTREVV
jgi:hypothetical protein